MMFQSPNQQPNQMMTVLNGMGNPESVVGRIRVREFMLVESGAYGKQFYRPFEFTIDGQTYNTLNTRVDKSLHTVGEVNPNVFVGLGDTLVKPTIQPQGSVMVPNGWETKRYQFILTVDIERTFGIETEIIMGYTDYSGIGGQGISNLNPGGAGAFIDPQMKFIINSISRVRNTSAPLPGGGQGPVSRNVISQTHLHANENYISSLAPNNLFLMSPANVFVNSGIGLFSEGGSVMNSAAEVSGTTLGSRINDVNPNAFMHKLLNNYHKASSDAGFGQNHQDIMAQASHFVSDDDPTADPFIYTINKHGHYEGYGTTNTFTLATLKKIDPQADANHVMKIVQLKQQARQALPSSAYCEDWAVSNRNTQMAIMINATISTIMMEFGIQTLTLTASNFTITGQPDVLISNAQGFSNIPVGHLLPKLRDRILNELIMNVTFNGAMKFNISADIRLWGESSVSLSFEGAPMVPYVVPSFADALFAPLVAPASNFLNNLSSNFVTLKEDLIERHASGLATSGMLGAMEQGQGMRQPATFNQPQQTGFNINSLAPSRL